MLTVDEINRAYIDLATRKVEYSTATLEKVIASTKLANLKAGALADGVITGKNAEEREASAKQLLAVEYARADDAELMLDKARLNLDLAALEVERLRTLLRLQEIAAKMLFQ